MSDVIGGIAVVEPLEKWPGLYRICLTLCYSDGHREPCSLLFHEASTPPSDELKQMVGKPIWCFRKDRPCHGWLDCQPSVRQRVSLDPHAPDRFHNTFNWQVQYVWLRYTACDARYNIWKILNQYGEDDNNKPLPPVTSETFAALRRDGYIC